MVPGLKSYWPWPYFSLVLPVIDGENPMRYRSSYPSHNFRKCKSVEMKSSQIPCKSLDPDDHVLGFFPKRCLRCRGPINVFLSIGKWSDRSKICSPRERPRNVDMRLFHAKIRLLQTRWPEENVDFESPGCRHY